MCDMKTLGKLGVNAGAGALGGIAQNKTGQPVDTSGLSGAINNRIFSRNRIGRLPTSNAPMNPLNPGAQSPMAQPNSTQAPQGSSTNDDMPNQMPGFGYRPQSGGFGDEDFLRKYFKGPGGIGGGQGFNV